MRMTPKEAMLMAIAEGKKGAGFVSPNPLVGCVILDAGYELLAAGFHARLGGAHAEAAALSAVKYPERLNGAHVFVTLEPCAHEGRTPSCAKALARLPIASVTYGLIDPNPRVSGQGAEILRRAGKTVSRFTELQIELEELAEIFLVNMREARPFVALKVAASLDGKIALPDGSSQWITGEEARAEVQSLRGAFDAVLTGSGTFLRDDPRLNARDPRFHSKRQRVLLLDPRGDCAGKLKDSRLLQVRASEDVYWVTESASHAAAANAVGVRHWALPATDGVFPLAELLGRLRGENVHSLFVEAGAGTVAPFLAQRQVDRVYAFLAPKILGTGLSWSEGLRTPSLAEAVTLRNPRVQFFGADILLTGLCNRPVLGT
jgi:diaminohydroxyphosphoribosylaminopyrimidine deaminase/5-amino-6-(5-phosphoribosylamino)uracil reductase